MLEQAVLLAFDVKIDKDAQELADELDVRIFKAEIIYHLFDQFTAYMNDVVENKKKALEPSAVFPCILKIVPGCVFNKKDPIVIGVDVIEGILRVETPLAVPSQGSISIGWVTSIELNHKPVDQIKRGGPSVAIKIESQSWEPTRLVGRHFTEADLLMSRITRQTIDVLKDGFREQMSKEDWTLLS